jgi:DNA polymerase-4
MIDSLQPKNRKIIHVDMDAFFASVEQRDNPELKGRPVAVGGSKERGVVAAASYEARKYGVYSAMSSVLAAKKCPTLIFVPPRFSAYQEVSIEIHKIFEEYTNQIEPLSLDEAYLDVTTNALGIPSATLIAKEIKAKIKSKTGLTATAGISYNKFLAKHASGLNKPDGLTVILPKDGPQIIEKLPVKKFHGIGKVTAEKLHKMGLFTGKDLKALSEKRMGDIFGKSGHYFYDLVRGVDHRPLTVNRERKSVGSENTFSRDIIKIEEIEAELANLATDVWKRISKKVLTGKTLTIKIKYHDFRQVTKSKTSPIPLADEHYYLTFIREVMDEIDWQKAPIRLLGISISNFDKNNEYSADIQQLTIEF